MNKSESDRTRVADATPSALAMIRSATAESHVAMERDIDWAKAFSTPHHYVGLLRNFLRVVEPLEQRLAGFERDGADAGGSRSDRLQRDIDAVCHCYRIDRSGITESRFNFGESFVVDSESAWGVRYVLEGSALGGQILSRQLHASRDAWRDDPWAVSLPVNAAPAMDNYFVGRGADTGLAWREFCCELNNHLCNQRAIDLAVRAAIETFGFFHSSLVGKAVCVRP